MTAWTSEGSKRLACSCFHTNKVQCVDGGWVLVTADGTRVVPLATAPFLLCNECAFWLSLIWLMLLLMLSFLIVVFCGDCSRGRIVVTDTSGSCDWSDVTGACFDIVFVSAAAETKGLISVDDATGLLWEQPIVVFKTSDHRLLFQKSLNQTQWRRCRISIVWYSVSQVFFDPIT